MTVCIRKNSPEKLILYRKFLIRIKSSRFVPLSPRANVANGKRLCLQYLAGGPILKGAIIAILAGGPTTRGGPLARGGGGGG